MRVTDVPVLIVEDDDDTRELLLLLLEGAGYRVSEARDGREGLARLRVTRGPLVVLLDWWMPRMDGLQMLGLAARLAHCQRHRYVLLSASYDPRELERRGLQALLAVTVLRKPFDIETVLAEVERQAATVARGAEDEDQGDDEDDDDSTGRERTAS